MQSQATTARPAWPELSGTILPGGYELKELIEADESAAQFRVRVLGDRSLDAIGQFVHPSADETARLVSIWDLMRTLRHRNLTLPLGSGSWDRDGAEFAYVVLRRADEALASVLRERALTSTEAKEVLASIVRALETLHNNGLVHGCISPEQVLAIGDAIQLPITCVRHADHAPEIPLVHPKYLAPESLDTGDDADDEDGENITVAADIWCLGATLFEALTCKEWTESSREETGALPEPFATIALRCLEEDPNARCKLSEVGALLRGEIRPPVRSVAREEPKQLARAATAGGTGLGGASPTAETAATTPIPVSLGAAPSPGSRTGAPERPPATTSPTAKVPTESRIESPSVTEPPARVERPKDSRSNNAPSSNGHPSAEPVAPRPAVSSPKVAESPTGRNIPAAAATLGATARATPSPREPSMVRSGTLRSAVPPQKSSAALTAAARNRIWLGVAVGLLVILALLWFLRPKTSVPSAPIAKATVSGHTRPSTSARNTPPAAAPNGETKILQPDGTATPKVTAPARPAAPVSSTPPAAAAPPVASTRTNPTTPKTINGDVWRVILYTYNRQEDAERKAVDINRRHPNLHTEVFSPEAGSGPYLVTIGAGTDRQLATQLRRQAVGSGMPRDTYIQNYSR